MLALTLDSMVHWEKNDLRNLVVFLSFLEISCGEKKQLWEKVAILEAGVLFEGNVKDDDFGKVVSISGALASCKNDIKRL